MNGINNLYTERGSMSTHYRTHDRRQAGFTLIEALIALVVMAFGMLALAGMQLTLSRSSDVAKQRTEAVRLAQREMDRLRSYTAIANSASHPINWASMASSSVTLPTSGTNTAYTMVTAFGGAASDTMRPVNITVSWNDRSGDIQTAVLSSVIAHNDPIDIGKITNPLPLNQPLKRPKNRNINIPIPAVDLGNNKSTTMFGGNYAIVYSNVSGGVVEICKPALTPAQAASAAVVASTINSMLTSGSCTTVNGYILAGYIGRSGGTVTFPAAAASMPLIGASAPIDVSSITRNSAAAEPVNCMYDVARDQNNANPSTNVIPNYMYYLCVVPLSPPSLYSGTLKFKGIDTTLNYFLCRYVWTQLDLDANEKNIQPYANVNKSIDEQNYMLVRDNSGTCPSSMTVAGVSTSIGHQDCRSSTSPTAATCPPYP
jgi:type IV pilus modification protein PilV